MPRLTFVALVSLFAVHALEAQEFSGEKPMQPIYQDGAEFRWLKKRSWIPAFWMEWKTFRNGPSRARAKWPVHHAGEGRRAFHPHQFNINIGRVDGSGDWQDLVATRKFPSEDWSHYNRISDLGLPRCGRRPGASPELWCCTTKARIYCRTTQTRAATNPSRLKNHEWNHIVWEIPPLSRHR